ncbi:GNAT family N-acetyltransferase [Haloterrigena sp. H1]|uniref:GNAT family N-acetyltransferase n=1 Tax=Haloterrigena sp. H1 TaxID=2552943 RepID=UPI00110DEEE1|nr:GNAT family N-acetyltransferase [Haloterrigena sp. H1]TMT85641.1 GNAT family N-acetyltransferase [Haloterrigena sp. H1]
MSVYPTGSFENELQRRIYEYVERNGAVTPAELARSIKVDGGHSDSKPARSRAYTESVPPTEDELQTCLETLQAEGYLTDVDGKFRIALSATTVDLECDEGAIVIRPAREEDRAGVVETMRTVAEDETYVVAENVAMELDRESALVRANEARSRIVFVAILMPEPEDDETESSEERTEPSATDGDVVGWLHIDAPALPALRHTAELTVGVDPQYQRQGIGSSLLEYGLEWASNAGYQKLYQNVPATNDDTLAFLDEHGWQRDGEHEGQYCLDGELVDEIMLAVWPDSE